MEDECFVCCGKGTDLLRPCSCDVAVHPECLRRMVECVPSHATQCPVCKTRYDVERTYRTRLVCVAGWEAMVLVHAVTVLMVFLLVLVLALGYPSGNTLVTFLQSCLLVVVPSSLVVSLAIQVVFTRRTRHICCVERSVVSSVVTVVDRL